MDKKWLILIPVLVGLLGACRGGDSEMPDPAISYSPPAILSPADPVTPGLQATITGGVPESMVVSARITPGVAKATRVGLSTVIVKGLFARSRVSVITVDPTEFRDLAPEVTSKASFVWKGLIDKKAYLTHDEQHRLGAAEKSEISIEGPTGIKKVKVGGFAANGQPNLAGMMISLDLAEELGLPEPNLLVVAVDDNDELSQIKKGLEQKLAGVNFGFLNTGRTFLSGPDSGKLFTYDYAINANGTITPDPSWVSKNIVTATVPILGSVRCHKIMIPQFRASLSELKAKGLASTVDPSEFAGCYVPRFIGRDVDMPLSMHAWGLAADINSVTNPMGAPSKQDPRMVAVFESWGFRWGGRWSPPDAHHFELAALVR